MTRPYVRNGTLIRAILDGGQLQALESTGWVDCQADPESWILRLVFVATRNDQFRIKPGASRTTARMVRQLTNPEKRTVQ